MANDPIKSDDEYHFSENETPNIYDSKNNAAAVNAARRKNVFITLGVIIVILAAYKLLGLFFSPSTKKVVIPTKVTTTTVTRIPSAPLTPSVASSTEIAAVTSRVDTLESTVSQVSTTLTDMSTKLNDLNTSLQTLSNEITQQQAQIATLQTAADRPRILEIRRRRRIRPMIPRRVYFIQGMLPGRAWLVTIGRQLTVKVGDRLPGYGVIQIIDTSQGEVVTSSGLIIGYSPGDS